MVVEALVLIGEQQSQIGRVDVLFRIDRQPPAAVLHRERAEQLAVAVDDGDGGLLRLLQRQRPERDDPYGEGGTEAEANSTECSNDANDAACLSVVMAGLDPAIHVFAHLTRR